MTATARDLIKTIRQDLTDDHEQDRFTPAIRAGDIPARFFPTMAKELYGIVTRDRDTFGWLKSRAAEPLLATYFDAAAHFQDYAAGKLLSFVAACEVPERDLADHPPHPGCQAFPSYLSWLAVHADPAAVILAVTVNLAGWPAYCAAAATSLREIYGFTDDACEFFDFFAAPMPGLEESTVTVIQAGIDAGHDVSNGLHQARLLRAYEIMFWNSLADQSRSA
jgi:hypothetical protein